MKTTITAEDIAKLIEASSFDGGRLGTKTSVLTCTLPNGFEVTATSACVDPANYDQAIGDAICKQRISDKLWELEGYRLQCALERNTAKTDGDS